MILLFFKTPILFKMIYVFLFLYFYYNVKLLKWLLLVRSKTKEYKIIYHKKKSNNKI